MCMKVKKIFFVAVMAVMFCGGAYAQDAGSDTTKLRTLKFEEPKQEELKPDEPKKEKERHFKFYGFIRNYFVFDTHESLSGAEELYYYMPTDDRSNSCSFNFVALTSRGGVDVLGYEFGGYKIGAKIEVDFYLKVNTTAALRLRQAYVTINKDKRSWKIGQAWHPMAADLPDIFSLESGAPFGPFSRTPQVNFGYKINDEHSITAAAIWQMQYTSTGPDGATADYLKRGVLPEFYLGYNYTKGSTIFRVGFDVLSIKPDNSKRLTDVGLFQYFQRDFGDFTLKEKLEYIMDGSHMNMVGGYGKTADTGDYSYSATRNLSAWVTLAYKRSKTWVPSIFCGYIKNFGTSTDVVDYWCKNNAGTMNNMFRIQPECLYNLGRLQFGLEYMLTSVQYGDTNGRMRAASNFHWVSNHRIQGLVKFTF